MAEEFFEYKSRIMAAYPAIHHQTGFEQNQEIFNLTTNMEMIGFSKTLNPQIHSSSSSSSRPINESTSDFYHHDSQFFSDYHPSPRPVSLSLSSSNNPFEDRNYGKQQIMEDEYCGRGVNLSDFKYLVPAQELLTEFCNLDSKETDLPKRKSKVKVLEEENNESGKELLFALDFMELQKRKSKLVSTLDEVDRRYKRYCDQIKSVVSSFESVAGNGAAKVYSTPASKVISKYFRCLRDGIVAQIQATMKAMGERNTAAPGTSKGETPRLKLVDQSLRHQRAFQQMNMMDIHPWRPQRGLPERSVSVLRAWLFEHFLHPYPSDIDKHILARQTGLSRSQVSNWFINARVRLWKPMVEEIYMEETKEQEDNNDGYQQPDNMVRVDSDCLSSIVIPNPKKGHQRESTSRHFMNQQSFGAMEMDFSSYNNLNFNGSNVSLTLGLQPKNGGSGVSLPFSSPLMGECEPVEYSLMGGDQGGNSSLPYRNLMEAQLLHDACMHGHG